MRADGFTFCADCKHCGKTFAGHRRLVVVAGANGAGKTTLVRRRALMGSGKDFLVETTLAGNSTVELVLEAAGLGYKVVFVYIGLDSVELHKACVRARVAAGGHDIAEKDIERRRERSLANVAKVLPMADRFLLLDNSGDDYLTLLRMRGDQEEMRAQELPVWVSGCLPKETCLWEFLVKKILGKPCYSKIF